MAPESRRAGSPIGKLAGAGTIALAGVGGAAVLGLIRAKGLAVTLEPSGFGVFGQLSAFALFAGTAGALGIGIGTTVLVAERRREADGAGLSTVAGLSVAMPLMAGIVLLCIALSASGVIAPLLLDEPRWGLVALAALSIPLVALQLPLQHLIQGFEDARGQTAAYLLYGIGFTIAAILGAITAGVTGAVVGLLLGNVLLVTLYLARGHQLVRRDGANFDLGTGFTAERRRYARRLVRIGGASLVVVVMYSVADLTVRIVLVQSGGQVAVGLWYALTLISIQFIASVYGAMTYLTMPLASRSAAGEDRREVHTLLDASLRITLITVLPLVTLIAALREQFAVVLFSSEFEELAGYLPAQLAGDVMRAIAWSLGVALIPLGLTRHWLAIGVGTSLVFGGVGAAGAVRWGLEGVVGAWVLAWAATALGTGVLLNHTQQWRPSRAALVGLAIGALSLTVAIALPGIPTALILVTTTVLILSVTVLDSTERAGIAQWWRSTVMRERSQP